MNLPVDIINPKRVAKPKKGKEIVNKLKDGNSNLKLSTIKLMEESFPNLGRAACRNLMDGLEAKENWATQLYYKSVLPAYFDKSWLSAVDISHIDLTIKSIKDISRICTELSTALLANNNKKISSSDLQDAVKMLSSLKTNEEVISAAVSNLTDDQIRAINTIVYPVREKINL